MFKVIKKSENRVDLELSGKLHKEEMMAAWDELEAASSQVKENGLMLYRIYDFDVPSFGAIMVELRHMPRFMKMAKNFDRVALMTGAEWLKKAAKLEGMLMPGLEVKVFGLEDIVPAETWLEKG